MKEKVLTFYDKEEMCIKGILIAKITDDDTLIYRNPLTLYSKEPLTSEILAYTSILRKRRIELSDLKKSLTVSLSNSIQVKNITLLEPFVLESNNKNETSRNQRMLEYMKLTDLERIDIYDKNLA